MSPAELFALGALLGLLFGLTLAHAVDNFARRHHLRAKRDPARDWYDPKEFRR